MWLTNKKLQKRKEELDKRDLELYEREKTIKEHEKYIAHIKKHLEIDRKWYNERDQEYWRQRSEFEYEERQFKELIAYRKKYNSILEAEETLKGLKNKQLLIVKENEAIVEEAKKERDKILEQVASYRKLIEDAAVIAASLKN